MDQVGITRIDLECMLYDESVEPKALPLSLLHEITNGFHEEDVIGRGGFAVVYKGVLGNGMVAVKKLKDAYLQETEFFREVECLMTVNHKNIVRFLGYCADTQGSMERFNKKFVLADIYERLLCFEYVTNGSLQEHITEASCGLEWKKRYQIIKGICEGLNYLHKNGILHLDLKPANILLDENMVPKITDFGLSRCFDEEQSWVLATKVAGTPGYLAPEFNKRILRRQYDIYSLGVIIVEQLTGEKGYHAIEDVLHSWRKRFEKSDEDIDIQLEQIGVCAEIGMQCIECNPEKRPQSTQYIIDRLEGTEPADQPSVAQMSPERGLLAVHGCQLRFPLFKPDEPISCPLRLTNNTSDHIAFRCFQKVSESFIDGLAKLHGIVPRRSTRTFFVFMEKLPPESLEAFDVILESCVAHKDIGDADDHFSPIFRNLLGGKVHQVPLQALCHPAGEMIICNIHPAERLCSMDVHPVKPWILVGHFDTGCISIWNYETGERMMKLNIIDDADQYFEKHEHFYHTRRAIFIAREHWIVVGDGHGVIHVRSCKTLELEGLKKFKAHNSMIGALGFHPTLPLLLSGCHEDSVINLWDWEKGWTCVAKFKHYGIEGTEGLMFNPQNESPEDISFASATVTGTIKIWSISAPLPIAKLDCDGERLYCLNYFFPGGDKQYIVAGSGSGNAHIWNLRTRKLVRKIIGLQVNHGSKVGVVNCPPDPPLLITSLQGYNIGLWDYTTSRYKNIFDFELGVVRYSVYIKQIRSVVIGFEGGLAMVEID